MNRTEGDSIKIRLEFSPRGSVVARLLLPDLIQNLTTRLEDTDRISKIGSASIFDKLSCISESEFRWPNPPRSSDNLSLSDPPLFISPLLPPSDRYLIRNKIVANIYSYPKRMKPPAARRPPPADVLQPPQARALKYIKLSLRASP
ncbi:hypothetical protein EVAR_396_1 [Eumeta japonica]|uniref:Uncharacterized protein n=1 Tax=Eumeta variegata TaxID=151549 RepID=A0A4C1SCW4_EUMVA|nr:hypothetical protein EVAR_396_1 [Eumeta japonica]